MLRALLPGGEVPPVTLSGPAELIVGLFDRGEGWTVDPYEVRHETGVKVWIANEDYGLSASMKGVNFNLTGADRKAIWGAFKAMRSADSAAKHDAASLALAQAIIAKYENAP
ncbi:hypothetical protein [Sphingomonas sp.]|uniref:hypothetical protein n=1 Tax=Sphingomonas sp. TaxID=28214 RepID=UPI003F6FA9E0